MSIDFAIWVALFASFATLISTIINSIFSYKSTKNNNEFLLKKVELELESKRISNITKSNRTHLLSAINEFSTSIPLYQSDSFKCYCDFWASYFNVYALVSDSTKHQLDNLKCYLDNHKVNEYTLKDKEFDSLIKKVTKEFSKEISMLK